MELHEVYQNVVKARPELAVEHLAWNRENARSAQRWTLASKRGVFVYELPPRVAESMIESHWLRALPHGYGVIRNYAEAPTFCVVKDVDDGQTSWGHPFESPLHALAEFHVPGSTREAKP